MSDRAMEVHRITKSFRVRGEDGRVILRAVDDASFTLKTGEILGLVGESGCGKSTLARILLRLIEPDGGEILFEGEPFTGISPRQTRRMRRNVQIVFQDALSSLNPRMTMLENIIEPMRLQGIGSEHERRTAAMNLIGLVGLQSNRAMHYPHEFSGGQCQRIAIARALILRPKVIIFDEATSALDVSIRAQILRLIIDLQKSFGFSYLFISHDMSVVKRIADRVAVMYLGRIVELGPSEDIYRNPLHPYTEALLKAIPIPDPRRMRVSSLGLLEGEAASPLDQTTGCAFRNRCAYRMPICSERSPALVPTEPHHEVACFRHDPRSRAER
jgi:oligopeptide transport system ATP-binding protein